MLRIRGELDFVQKGSLTLRVRGEFRFAQGESHYTRGEHLEFKVQNSKFNFLNSEF